MDFEDFEDGVRVELLGKHAVEAYFALQNTGLTGDEIKQGIDELYKALCNYDKMFNSPVDVCETIEKSFKLEASGLRDILKIDFCQRVSLASKFMRPGTLAILAGSPGATKSLFSLAVGLGIEELGKDWAYLPLEMTQESHVRRLIGLKSKNFAVSSGEKLDANLGLELFNKFKGSIFNINKRILRNPLMEGSLDKSNYKEIIKSVEQLVNFNRLVIVDPFANIDFGEGNAQYERQASLIKDMGRIAHESQSTIMLVIHTNKTTENHLTLSDVEGSKRITGLADVVLLLKAIKTKSVNIVRRGGNISVEDINRIMYVAKSRHSSGSGTQIGFQFGMNGRMEFKEVGVIE